MARLSTELTTAEREILPKVLVHLDEVRRELKLQDIFHAWNVLNHYTAMVDQTEDVPDTFLGNPINQEVFAEAQALFQLARPAIDARKEADLLELDYYRDLINYILFSVSESNT